MLVKIGAALIAPLSLWARVTTGPSVSHMCVCSALSAALLGPALYSSSNGFVRPSFLCSDEGFGVSSSLGLTAVVARYGPSLSLYPSFCSGGSPETPLSPAEEQRLGALVARLQTSGHSLITSRLLETHPASVLRPLLRAPPYEHSDVRKECLRSLHALLSPLCLSLELPLAVYPPHHFVGAHSECLLASRALGTGAAGPLAGPPLLVFSASLVNVTPLLDSSPLLPPSGPDSAAGEALPAERDVPEQDEPTVIPRVRGLWLSSLSLAQQRDEALYYYHLAPDPDKTLREVELDWVERRSACLCSCDKSCAIPASVSARWAYDNCAHHAHWTPTAADRQAVSDVIHARHLLTDSVAALEYTLLAGAVPSSPPLLPAGFEELEAVD